MKYLFSILLLCSPLALFGKIQEVPLGLSYADVALEPKYTEILSYDKICIKTYITKTMSLNVPLISAGISGIIEIKMAIALAQEGCLGVTHSDCDVEQQAFEVRKVKRHRGAIIENPVTIHVDATLQKPEKYHIPVIADGGINRSGNIAVAIGAGASAVMIGTLFAGSEESPGDAVSKDGKQYKVVNGAGIPLYNDPQEFVPGGVEGLIPYKGQVKQIIKQLIIGLHSGMYQHGTRTIEDLKGQSTFVRITPAGVHKALPHDIIIV